MVVEHSMYKNPLVNLPLTSLEPLPIGIVHAAPKKDHPTRMLSQSSRGRRLRVRPWVLAGALLCIARDSATQDIGTRAVVVESVDEGSAGHRAGILPGDVFTSWERAVAPPANPFAEHGQVTSPFDLDEIEIEQAPRGIVTLSGMRRGQPLTVTVPPGRWRIAARPAMSAETLESDTSGRSAAAEGQVDAAVAAWRSAASAARDERTGAWLLLQGGSHCAMRGG